MTYTIHSHFLQMQVSVIQQHVIYTNKNDKDDWMLYFFDCTKATDFYSLK